MLTVNRMLKWHWNQTDKSFIADLHEPIERIRGKPERIPHNWIWSVWHWSLVEAKVKRSISFKFNRIIEFLCRGCSINRLGDCSLGKRIPESLKKQNNAEQSRELARIYCSVEESQVISKESEKNPKKERREQSLSIECGYADSIVRQRRPDRRDSYM